MQPMTVGTTTLRIRVGSELRAAPPCTRWALSRSKLMSPVLLPQNAQDLGHLGDCGPWSVHRHRGQHCCTTRQDSFDTRWKPGKYGKAKCSGCGGYHEHQAKPFSVGHRICATQALLG